MEQILIMESAVMFSVVMAKVAFETLYSMAVRLDKAERGQVNTHGHYASSEIRSRRWKQYVPKTFTDKVLRRKPTRRLMLKATLAQQLVA